MQALTAAPTVVTQLHHSEPRVTAVVGELSETDRPPGDGLPAGVLLVSETSVTWWCEAEQRGFELQYRALALHAVSRDGGVAGGVPCIYCQVYRSVGEDETDELRLIPESPASLDAIFSALSECQALHPDDDGDDGELDAGGELYVGDGHAIGNGANGAYDADMFADADEDGDGDAAAAEYGDEGAAEYGDAVSHVELTPEGLATMERLSNLLLAQEGTDPSDAPDVEETG